jgi:hypothetical protein
MCASLLPISRLRCAKFPATTAQLVPNLTHGRPCIICAHSHGIKIDKAIASGQNRRRSSPHFQCRAYGSPSMPHRPRKARHCLHQEKLNRPLARSPSPPKAGFSRFDDQRPHRLSAVEGAARISRCFRSCFHSSGTAAAVISLMTHLPLTRVKISSELVCDAILLASLSTYRHSK